MRRQAAEANAAKEQRVQSQRNAGVPTMNARASGDGDAANAGKRARAKPEVGGDEKKREPLPKPDYAVACPRCKSDDTKFCYYNNYNVKQPRFYCKKCCRYWTEGGIVAQRARGRGTEKEEFAQGCTRGDSRLRRATMINSVGGKRARCTPATPAEKGSNRNRTKTARTKRDGSSDGSATEAEQGEGMNSGYGGRQPSGWNTNGSNAGSDTALRGRSPTDEQGSAEGSQQAPGGDAVPMGYNVSRWGIDPAVARYVNAGMLSTSDEQRPSPSCGRCGGFGSHNVSRLALGDAVLEQEHVPIWRHAEFGVRTTTCDERRARRTSHAHLRGCAKNGLFIASDALLSHSRRCGDDYVRPGGSGARLWKRDVGDAVLIAVPESLGAIRRSARSFKSGSFPSDSATDV